MSFSILPDLKEDIVLAMSNGVLLWLCVVGVVLLANYMAHIITKASDILGIFTRAMSSRKRGGVLDVAFAFAIIMLGFAIRTEAAWAWRAIDSTLRLPQLIGGTLVTACGILLLIKTLAPQNRWRVFFCLAVTGSALFAALTWWLSVD